MYVHVSWIELVMDTIRVCCTDTHCTTSQSPLPSEFLRNSVLHTETMHVHVQCVGSRPFSCNMESSKFLIAAKFTVVRRLT